MINVVIAEDQTLVLGALAALLELTGDIKVVGRAASGDAAYKLVTQLAPDVLVTDIEMQGLSGLDLAARLKSENSTTKVVVVTTFARPGYLRRALDIGVQGYLLKDGPSEVLADAVRTAMTGGRIIAPELADQLWSAAPDPLTDRERDCLKFAEFGRSNKEIAIVLGLSAGTVRNYLSDAAQKLGAANRIEAGRVARMNGWL
jgi:two-component system, NarL family, response regulator DesR